MIIDDFLPILDEKLGEIYTYKLCNSIIRLYETKNNIVYSIDDIKQDLILYFIEKDKISKIINKNGARISIEFYLKTQYKKIKGYTKEKYYNDLLFLTPEQVVILKKIGFNKKYLLLHAYLYFNAQIKKLNLSEFLKGNQRNYYAILNDVLDMMYLICDLNKYENLNNIYKYFKDNTLNKNDKIKLIPDMFWDAKNDGTKRRVDYRILKYIKEIYRKEVDILFGNKL